MNPAVDELVSLVPPPVGQPLTQVSWPTVEKQLGVTLPADYKAIVETYGSGSFDGFIWLLVPRASNQHLDLVRQRSQRLDALRNVRDQGEHVPFSLEPGHEELVPWAITDNGDVCFWVRTNAVDPNEWTVAVNGARSSTWVRTAASVSEILVAVLSGSLRLEVFPDDFPSANPRFMAL